MAAATKTRTVAWVGPVDLRERLSLGVRGLSATRSPHAELAELVRPAG